MPETFASGIVLRSIFIVAVPLFWVVKIVAECREKRPVASDLICLLFYRICGKIARKKGAAIETEQQTENFTVFQNYNKISEPILDK